MISKLNFFNNIDRNSKFIKHNLLTLKEESNKKNKKKRELFTSNSANITTKINNRNKSIIEDIYSIQQIKHVITDKMNIDFLDSSKLEVTSLKKDNIPYNINVVWNKGIRILNNVYQSKYDFGKSNCTGLGDFIRGSYFILEFCYKHGFQPKIIFNSCISKFLNIKTDKLELIQNVLRSVEFFKSNNMSSYNIQNGFILDPIKNNAHIMSEFVDYMVKSPVYYNNVFMFCNSFPMENNIPEKNKEYMRTILEPTAEMKQYVYNILGELKLSVNGYNVIHVRSGDIYLKNETNNFGLKYIKKLVDAIRSDIRFNGEEYLVIADNNSIKIALKNIYPDFKIFIKEITHFGEGVVLNEEKVKNSLLDFYLLSFAKTIISYSCYDHGSGFSCWCAKTYNIPYMCRHVK
jgi:hypothetical protein